MNGEGGGVSAEKDALDALSRMCADETQHVDAFDAVYKALEPCAGGRCAHEYDYECGSDALLTFVTKMRKEPRRG